MNKIKEAINYLYKQPKWLTAILILLLISPLSWGQADTVFIKYNKDKFEDIPNYKTDTIIFDTPNARQILYGTTVLPWTLNQQITKSYGLYFDSLSMTLCQQKEEFWEMNKSKPRVLSINHVKDNLTIEIKHWANCCHSFLCDIEVIDDTTLNLIIHGYGATYCACECCFGLTFHLTTLEVENFDKLKYVTINGDERTKKVLK